MFGPKVTPVRGIVLLIAVGLILGLATSVSAIESIRVTVGDTTGDAGTDNSVVTVFLQNFKQTDTVAAFELWLQLSRPGMVEFVSDIDTVVDTSYWYCREDSEGVCIDSVSCNPDSVPGYVCLQSLGELCTDSVFVNECPIMRIDLVEALVANIDTVGTRISGWQLVTSRSITGTPRDIKIIGAADSYLTPGSATPIAPGSGVLFRLNADILPISDTVGDRSVNILPQAFLDHMNFSRPDGSSIGIVEYDVIDTNYWRCNAWVPPDSEVCLSYERVNEPPYDSVTYEATTDARIDSAFFQCLQWETPDEIECLQWDSLEFNPGDSVPYDSVHPVVNLRPGAITVNLYPGACCITDSLGNDSCVTATGVDGCEFLMEGTYKGDGTVCTPTICLTCCVGPMRGNVDNDPEDVVSLGDLTVLIDHLFVSFDDLPCWDEANMDASQPEGETSISLGDLTVLIDHLFVSFNDLPPCP